MTDESELCPCGRPLHYSNADIEMFVRSQIAQLGPNVIVNFTSGPSYEVPRHYIALHGLSAAKAAEMGFTQIQRKKN